MWEAVLSSWFLNAGINRKIHTYAVNISTFLCVFLSRKSIKKLVLKNLNSSNLFSPVSRDNEDLASPSEYPENGDRCVASSGCCFNLRETQTGSACLCIVVIIQRWLFSCLLEAS